jgi:clan AA aspartic protease
VGTFSINIGVGDPQGQQYTPIRALVDTGSSYTALPASFLQRLGVPPRERGLFELADGRMVERDVGQTWVQIDGRTAIVPVVFADEGAGALLGAVTLEIFRLAVDPVKQRLMPVPGLLMASSYLADGRFYNPFDDPCACYQFSSTVGVYDREGCHGRRMGTS